MSTLRSIKRAQRNAKLVLMRRGYHKDNFFRATGDDEFLYAPKSLRVHQRRYGFMERLLPGTWLIGRTVGYYEPEWEEVLPSDELKNLRIDERTDWEKKMAEFKFE